MKMSEPFSLKDPLMGLKQFLTMESPLKFMNNAFHFMLQALFVLEIFSYLSLLLGYVEKWLDRKSMVNFRIYDATDWTTNNYNTHITQYLDKQRHAMKFGQLIKYSVDIFLFKNHAENEVGRLVQDLFLFYKCFI